MDRFFFQAEDGIRDLVRSRGLGDVYKRQIKTQHTRSGKRGRRQVDARNRIEVGKVERTGQDGQQHRNAQHQRLAPVDMAQPPATCLLYTSDAADERSSVDLGGRRIVKKKKK